MILVRRHDWATTPLFYYLRHDGLAADNYRALVAANAPARSLWLCGPMSERIKKTPQ